MTVQREREIQRALVVEAVHLMTCHVNNCMFAGM